MLFCNTILPVGSRRVGSAPSTFHSFRFTPAGDNQVAVKSTGTSESPWDGAHSHPSDRMQSEVNATKENHMSPEDSKALGRRLVDAINAGNLIALDELFAPGYVDRNPFPGATPGRAGFKQSLTTFRRASARFRYTIEDEVAGGGQIGARLTPRGDA